MPVTEIHKDPVALTMTVISDFPAPPQRIWQLWSDPRQLERWWGPPSYPATVVDHTLTPGGRVTYFMTGPDGERFHGWWQVLAVEAPHRLEIQDGFADDQGQPNPDMPITTMQMTLQQHDPSSLQWRTYGERPAPEWRSAPHFLRWKPWSRWQRWAWKRESPRLCPRSMTFWNRQLRGDPSPYPTRCSIPYQMLWPRRSDADMTDHAVVIAGAGPTGLMLAGELALAGVDTVIVERRTDQHVDGSRAGGLHARTIEVLDQRGIAERFIGAGYTVPALGFAQIPLEVSDLPTRHNYVLALWQSRFEPILAGWVEELGVPILRGQEVTGFSQHDGGVEIDVSGGVALRADYLVGCDGGRSLVRKAAGIDFAGLDASTSWMIAEVEMDREPELGFRRDNTGSHALGRAADGASIRVVLTEPRVDNSGEPGLEELRQGLFRIYGTDYGLRRATWISRFTDMTRQAASYRSGRVLLAGDAAHVHPPQGGQGLNTGVQDAVNLGWKLAQVVKGALADRLLDTYHAERYPVGARVLHNTMAQVALSGPDDRHQALRDTITELLGLAEPRQRIAGMVSGLDIHYDLGPGHPLVGRRMPDLDVHIAEGPTRVFALLHDARPLLLNLGEPGGFGLGPWANRVRLVHARHDGVWQLPTIGEVEAPAAVLIRPDGHVAWTGELTDPELPHALTRWFGPAIDLERAGEHHDPTEHLDHR